MLHLRHSRNTHSQTQRLPVLWCSVLQRQMPNIKLEKSQKGTSSLEQGVESEEHRGRDERRGGGGGGGGGGG